MNRSKNKKKKNQSLDKSSISQNKKSIIIYDGDHGNMSENSDFSLPTRNFEKTDDDILSKSSEENIEDKLARLMKIKKEGGNIENNISLKQEPIKKRKTTKENLKQKEEKKDQSKLTNKSFSMSKTNQNFDDSSIENRSIYKIKAKKRKLELLKKRQENYLKLVAIQRKRREEELKILQEKIAIQNKKLAKLQEGYIISETASLGDEYDSTYRIENGLAMIEFVIKNNKSLKMLEFMNKFGFYDTLKNFQSLRDITLHGNRKEEEAEKQREKEKAEQIKRQKDKLLLDKEKQEKIKEEFDDEEDKSENDDTFIKLEPVNGDTVHIDRSKLVEYDTFYKEQFFKNEVFKYDVDNIQDKEIADINKEMRKLDTKRRLLEKQKIREVNKLKGFDVTELDEEIAIIQKEYDDVRKIEEKKLDMIMNNTEGFLSKGRILRYYFEPKVDVDYPRFSLENEKEQGAREIIDFKVLRKEEVARRYFDYYCCLEQRKKINKWLVYARYSCRIFIDNWMFDDLSLCVIIANTLIILVSDPTKTNNLGNASDSYFLYFYTVEAILKMISFTFYTAEDAYIRDPWNILDICVVIVGWISFILENITQGTKISGLAGLRALRILRPLKTVKSIKGLKILVTALLSSIGHLGETGIILFFFFLIFAIAGRQMWQGLFYRRCMNVNFGYLYSTYKDRHMCSFDSDCKDLTTYGMRFICAKGYRNPDGGAINFDNVLTGFVTIFVMATLEGWTNVFTYVSKTFKDKIYVNQIIIFLFFHFFVFLASFYLLKLFLAVNNAEYENIEVNKNMLLSKKSFFELIQSRYDKKMKERKEIKEKEKQARANIKKRSDEVLVELYYKVNDQAFHINRNKRNIPILYSTIKDMYIMANNNPEELYLQSLRIEEEESLLCKDIKRQQKEIDILIDQKRAEIKKEQNKEDLLEEEEKNADNNLNQKNTIDKKLDKKEKVENQKYYSVYQNTNKKRSKKNELVEEEMPQEIEKNLNSIVPDLIELSIDYTQKYLKDEMNSLTKTIRNEIKTQSASNKKGKKMKKNQTNINIIEMKEDLPYEKLEKEEKLKKEKEKEKKEKEKEKEKNEALKKDVSKVTSKHEASLNDISKINISDNNINKKDEISENNNDKNKEDHNVLGDEEIDEYLSFMSDLSLPGCKEQNEEYEEDFYRRLNEINPDKSREQIEEEFKNEPQKNLISDITNDDVYFTEKKVLLKKDENIISNLKFSYPKSILNPLIKLLKDVEIQNKLEKVRKHFNLENFIENEINKGTKINLLGRQNSYLEFLKYASKCDKIGNIQEEDKKENNNLLISKESNDENEKKENANDKSKTEISFLSKDSYLVNDKNVSLDDINLLPKNIRENKTSILNFIANENVSKNIESNKLQQMIRNSVFDRQSVNTNIDLTSKEQAKYFKNMNKKLNTNLYSDVAVPRRRKDMDLDISHIFLEKDYDDKLQSSNGLNVAAQNSDDEYFIEENKDEEKVLTDINKNATNLANLNDKNNKKKGKSNKKKKGFYIFKAKSIEKNNNKYPKENTNQLAIKEENKPYSDPLTLKQESIPDNYRGKKYYLNYLYNISDKDLKVKDNFNVGQWVDEILGKKEKFFKKKRLPESKEAFFVFNDKKLNLKKYKFFKHEDYEYKDNEASIITHNLKFLPYSILQFIPFRLRDYGKFCAGREINAGALGIRATTNTLKVINTKNKLCYTNSRSGRTITNINKNSSSIILASGFANHRKTMEEVNYKKNASEKIYKKVDEFNYKTLAHYFLLDDEIYKKFIDQRKVDEKLLGLETFNREKQNRLEVKSEVDNIKVFDIKTNSVRYVEWSGADVLYNVEEDEYRKKWNRYIDYLENFAIIIWNNNPMLKNLEKMRYAFYVLGTNDYFDYFILTLVVANSIIMALDGNLLKPEVNDSLNLSNYIFNSIFIFEYLVKFIGFGPVVYYSDAFTYLDTIIIIFAVVDMCTPTTEDTDTIGAKKSVSSQLSFLRVFRIFRVIRLTKILRRFKSTTLIITSIKRALANVGYITCILCMFILIFVLLGMSLLNGNDNYQSFLNALYATYQIMTLEGWNNLLIELWPMSYFSFFFFLAWIVIGNFVLINLFISILLQSFGERGDEEDDDLTEDEQLEKMFSLPDYLHTLKKRKNSANVDNNKGLQKRKKTNNNILFNESTSIIQTETKSQFSSSNMNTTAFTATSEDEDSESEYSDDDDDIDEDDENAKTLTKVEKNIKEWQRVNKLFKKNECENSLFVFSQTNKCRIMCLKIITNKWFDRFILIVILLSTVRLIVDTFVRGYTFVFAFEIIDAVFNGIFLIEAILKVIALGFAIDEGSYLRDNWSKLDFIIVLCSIFDFYTLFAKYVGNSDSNSTSSLQFLKVFRLLRTLRPLRFISHNIQLKLIITSLFDSIVPICFTLFILIVVYYIFSIVGISIFYNSMHNCYVMRSDGTWNLAISSFNNNLADYQIKNDMSSISTFCADKYNGLMDTGPTFKYSNILQGFITSYILSTMEGWPDIMDSYNVYSRANGLFFIVYNFVVAYFFLNLFTGIMFRYFNEAYRRETHLAPNDKKAPKYYDYLNQIYSANSHYSVWVHPPKGSFRYYIREFVESAFLDNFIMAIIGLNMLTMAVNYENRPTWLGNLTTMTNYVFSGIFIAECLVKLFGFGIFGYFHSGWNKFDCFVVVASIADIVVANIDGIDAAFLKSFQIIRVLRVLRVTRALRLVKSLKNLEKLIQTLSWSLAALVNVGILMIIIFSIFSILGVFFYEDIYYADLKAKFTYVNEYYNLDNFYNAFLLIFRISTGENWPNIMMEYAYCDDNTSVAYAYILFIVGNFATHIIMINLFLMVTLQQYDEFTGKSYNPIEKFELFLVDFNNAWNKYSEPKDYGYRIKKVYVVSFFNDFNWKKLSFPDQDKIEHIKKYVSEIKLRVDNQGYIYYHDVIFKVLYNQMGSQVDRANPENQLILKTEKRVQDEIRVNINSYIKSHQPKLTKKEVNNMITFNPLTSHLYFKVSFLYFRTFLNYYKENAELLRNMDEDQMNQQKNDEVNNSNNY